MQSFMRGGKLPFGVAAEAPGDVHLGKVGLSALMRSAIDLPWLHPASRTARMESTNTALDIRFLMCVAPYQLAGTACRSD